jgi:hypothetical protein
MAGKIYHPEAKHPQTAQQDLSPDANKGLNYGMAGPAIQTRNAAEMKEMHDLLPDFTPEELKQMSVTVPGTRLETGATYLNLVEGERKEIRALGNEEVRDGDLFIAKKDVPYELWNRLLGIKNPARTLDR